MIEDEVGLWVCVEAVADDLTCGIDNCFVGDRGGGRERRIAGTEVLVALGDQ